MSDDFKVGKIEKVVVSDNTIVAGEGNLHPNPLEYAPTGTLNQLTQAQARIEELEALVREMGAVVKQAYFNSTFSNHYNEKAAELLRRSEVKAIMKEKP